MTFVSLWVAIVKLKHKRIKEEREAQKTDKKKEKQEQIKDER